MWSFLYITVITSHYLAHSLHILYINLELAVPSEASPSSCHMYLEHQPYRQSHKQLCNMISQWALLYMPIWQYRSYDPLFLIPYRVYLGSLLYPLLNSSLSLNHGTIKPYGLWAPLHMVSLYLLIWWSWYDINLLYLTISYLLYSLRFTTSVYL